jgi:hypothetical protein
MAINRDIVATRKLNKKNKARLGRRGADGVKDTKIREVAGRESHVNALEAYLIDVDRKAGQEYALRVGAGTTNPLTGMPEYHSYADEHTHTDPNDDSSSYWLGTGDNIVDAGGNKVTLDSNITDPNLISGETDYSTFKGELTFEQIKNLTPDQRGAYLEANYGLAASGDYEKYFTDTQAKPFEFIGEQQELTTGRALETKEFTEKGLAATQRASGREAGIARAGIQETLTGTRESLSRGFSSGMTQARRGAETAMAKSGLARSGTITGALGRQMKALTQGYTTGIETAGRQADIGMAGVDVGQQTAAESYTLGMEGAGADYDYALAGADLGSRKGTYTEEQRQKERFYDEIGALQSFF